MMNQAKQSPDSQSSRVIDGLTHEETIEFWEEEHTRQIDQISRMEDQILELTEKLEDQAYALNEKIREKDERIGTLSAWLQFAGGLVLVMLVYRYIGFKW